MTKRFATPGLAAGTLSVATDRVLLVRRPTSTVAAHRDGEFRYLEHGEAHRGR